MTPVFVGYGIQSSIIRSQRKVCLLLYRPGDMSWSSTQFDLMLTSLHQNVMSSVSSQLGGQGEHAEASQSTWLFLGLFLRYLGAFRATVSWDTGRWMTFRSDSTLFLPSIL